MSLKLIIFYRKQRKKKRARAKKAAIANNANEANGEAAPGTDSDESKTNYLSFKHWKQWIAIKTSIKRDEGIQLEDCKVEETALVHPEPGPRRVIIRTKVTTDDQQVTKADMYISENTCLRSYRGGSVQSTPHGRTTLIKIYIIQIYTKFNL